MQTPPKRKYRPTVPTQSSCRYTPPPGSAKDHHRVQECCIIADFLASSDEIARMPCGAGVHEMHRFCLENIVQRQWVEL